MNEQDRIDSIQGLKDVIAFLEAHPSLPTPRFITMNTPLTTRAELAAIARLTTWEKSYGSCYFALRKTFGEHVLDYYVPREEVCHKVVTGARIVPAVEAQPERKEEVTEWVCDDVALLGPSDVARIKASIAEEDL